MSRHQLVGPGRGTLAGFSRDAPSRRCSRCVLASPLAKARTGCDTPAVLVVRGTKKFRDRVSGVAAEADDEPTTVLGAWFATALFWRPQVTLLVNERTLLPVFLPLAPASTVLQRIPAAIERLLRLHGADDAFVAREVKAMAEVRVGPTSNRSVLGVMNEFAFLGGIHWQERPSDDLDELSLRLASTPMSPLYGRHLSPDRELAALVTSGP